MQCGRVQLQERTKARNKVIRPATTYKPRRYCQKRLVNPQHEEDPRWIDVLERFRYNEPVNKPRENHTFQETIKKEEDLYLTVQTLQFKGTENLGKRPRTSFKYKTVSNGNLHRMFVKKVVANEEQSDEDRSSQLTCYYYDDYAKYLSNTVRSRSSSGKSSRFLQGVASRFKANKAVQVDFPKTSDIKKARKTDIKNNSDLKSNETNDATDLNSVTENNTVKDTTIFYQNCGKRKSLTISRTQSPETVQVIRVDVVCNCNTSPVLFDTEDAKSEKQATETIGKKTETVNIKNSHFANKYLLTNTIKTLDESVSGGAKVTLLCKTFRLTDRSKMLFNRKPLKFDIAKVTTKSKVRVQGSPSYCLGRHGGPGVPAAVTPPPVRQVTNSGILSVLLYQLHVSSMTLIGCAKM